MTNSVIILLNISVRIFFYTLAILWIITPFDAHAVPAAPILHTLTQPDGTTFTARQWGDEWSHGWEDSDGYTIVQDKQTRQWTYAVADINGALTNSSRIAGRDLPPSGIPKKLRPIKQALEQILSIKQSASAPQYVVAPTGTANVPVFLVNFSDTATTYTAGDFNSLLFGNSVWSMKDYYEEVSYGAFSVSAGPEGVKDWHTASNTHDYYGTNVGANDDDAWPGDLVYEVVFAADASGYDFAPYDMDGDCYVDVVNIVHQGTGEEVFSSPPTDIWSHSWSLNGALFWGQSHYGEFTTSSPCPSGGFIKVDDYVIQPEILDIYIRTQQTMGVFAHEYAHALGLPDLYDTDGSSNGVGDWSLMDSGSWNYSTQFGDRPAHLEAWSKYFLGWVTPTQVSGLLNDEPIDQVVVESDPDIYKFLTGTPLSGQYFLVENRQKVGFDSGLPASGLLIWHIDGSKINSTRTSNTVNTYECYPGGPSCATNHYGVKLMQADNLWELEKGLDLGDAGDPYPGTSNNRTFNGSSSPNSNLYNNSQSYVSISGISNSGTTMTATLSDLVPDTTPPAAPVSLNATPSSWTNSNSFSIDWTDPADPSGIAGAYYKIGALPTSNTNGTYTTSKPFIVSASAEGGQTIYVWLKDRAGNVSYLNRASTSLNYDNTAPSAPVSPNATPSSWTNTNSFSVDWTDPADASGIAETYYKIGSAPTSDTDGTSTASKPINVSATAEGGQNIYLWLVDGAGNLNYLNRAFTSLNYDHTAPSDGTLNTSPGDAQASLSWSGFSDSGGSGLKSTNTYQVMRSSGTYPSSQCSDGTQVYLGAATSAPDTGLTNDITYYYRICAYDNAGNISDGGTATVIPHDNVPPSSPVNLNATPSSWTNTNSFSIDWTDPADSSGIAGAYYKIGSSPTSNTDGTYTTNKPFLASASSEGGQTIYVWLVDGNGNIDYSSNTSTTLYYDNTAPADGTLSASVDSLSALLSWAGSTDTGGSGVSTYKLVFSTSSTPATCNDGTAIYTGSDASYTHSPLANATTYYYRVCAIDSAGNMSSGSTNNAFVGIATTLPAEGAEYTSCSYYSPPTFQWDTDDTFKKIEVQFSTDNFASKYSRIKAMTGINEISISKKWKKILTMPGIEGGTVYWRVVGIKPDKSVVYSNTVSFTVAALEPASDMDISPSSRSSLPTISWENNCAISFKVWFANDSDFQQPGTVLSSLSFKIPDPNNNGGVFSLDLLAKEWENIRSVVGDTSGSTIYWYVESWDVLKRYAKTSVESFVLDP